MKKNKKIIIGAVVSLLIILIVVANILSGSATDSSSIKVKAAPVKKDTVSGTVSLSGKVDLMERVEIRPNIIGTLVEYKYALGEKVAKNAVVARLESNELIDQRRQAQEAYDAVVKKKEDIKKQLNSTPTPTAGGTQPIMANTPQADQTAALSAVDQEIKVAKTSLDKINSQVESLNLKAPEEGLVLNTSVSPGQKVSPEQPVAVLGDLNNLIVRAQVSEMDLLKLAKGQQVSISSDAVPDKTYQGEVVEVGLLPNDAGTSVAGTGSLGGMTASPSITGTTRSESSYQVTIKVTDKDTQLRPGFNADVEVTLQKKEHVLVAPIEAVLDMSFGNIPAAMGLGAPTDDKANKNTPPNQKKVYVLGKNSQVEERQVKIGITGDTYMEITEGLKEGDKVILSPDEKTVQPGIKVKAE